MKKKKSSVEQTIAAVEEILMESFKPAPGHVLCLKSLPANLQAYEGFQWPEIGHVKAPDWLPVQGCGNGLHAFKWGVGDSDLACLAGDAKWLVMSVREEGMIDLDGKVKFEECEVVFCGAMDIAVSIILHHAPVGAAVMFATVTGGDGATVTGQLWSVLVIEYRDNDADIYKKKAAVVDGVNFLPGMKYKLNDEFVFIQVNDTEA